MPTPSRRVLTLLLFENFIQDSGDKMTAYFITFAIPATIILLSLGVLGYIAEETTFGKRVVARIIELLDL